jgi:hypothetical protein
VITVADLKAKAAGRYPSTITRLLLGENPFPVDIGYKRPRLTGDPAEILALKELLRSQSKERLGFGFTVEFSQVQTRKYGAASVPGRITFETLDDLTRYIGKKTGADRILQHAQIVLERLPTARAWVSSHHRTLAEGDDWRWAGITATVEYFIQHPLPWVYPRELPLGLQTKFLEQNYQPIIAILTHVAPQVLKLDLSTWQDRLGLRSSSGLIEGRFLDQGLAPALPEHMLTTVDDWNRCVLQKPRCVLITENRTTFLSLPPLAGCLALLGKGYAVTRLAELKVLHECPVFYWGDIDQHGFEILSTLRALLPSTQSVMMDETTLSRFKSSVGTEAVEATLPPDEVGKQLTEPELILWKRCVDTHLRLEQEHIPHSEACSAFRAVLPQ